MTTPTTPTPAPQPQRRTLTRRQKLVGRGIVEGSVVAVFVAAAGFALQNL